MTFCAKKKENYCAHGRAYHGTCYNKFELLLLIETIETREGGRRLHFHREGTIRQLWKDVAAYMKVKHKCTDELCWVEKLKMPKVEASAFKPKMPAEWLACDKRKAPNHNCMNSWLSNIDLNQVMEQFAANVPSFAFLGSVPIDFDTARSSNTKAINNFNVSKSLKEGKTQIGVIFNTQPSTMGGEHWICAFIDLRKKAREINFFDSYGNANAEGESEGEGTPPEVEAFLQRVLEQAKKAHMPLVLKKNTVRHQFKNSECGVYCLKFIADRLGAKTFEDITQGAAMPDNLVVQERFKRFFRAKECRPT